MGARRDDGGGAQPAARRARPPPPIGAPAEICEEDVAINTAIGRNGLPLIEAIAARKKPGERVNVLTHCNAGWLAAVDVGTATAPIYLAHDNGIAIHVFADETRPRNQGASLTAWELGQHGVPHTLIADNTGGHLMQHGLVDLVIVGTDRVTANGDVCNKIGTYLKALAARDNNVPFYVALPSPTIDFTVADGVAEIPIEQRGADEVATMTGRTADGRIETVRIAPEGSPVANYGFDVTPARLVTGLITERGVIAASRAALGGGFSGARRRGRMSGLPGPFPRGDDTAIAQSESVACVSSNFGRSPNLPLPGILTMSVNLLPAAMPVDGRQSQTALAIARGTARFLHALGYCVVSELPLPSGRRADLVALGGDGEILIVEIKSSVADFRADQKWMDYRLHCDRLFFATIVDVPCEIFPADAGLIVADAFGASIVCEAPEHRLAPARRKTVMLRFAHAAALRLQALADPQGPYGGEM